MEGATIDKAGAPLPDADFASIQRYVDAIVEGLAALHLSVTIETDFTALYRFLRTRPGAIVNSTFNPFESDLSRDSFWLRVVDADDNTVACHAQRVFVVEDFTELIRSGRLFSTIGQPCDPARSQIVPPSRLIAGSVAYAGSLWVDVQYRKQGLSVWLPYLSRLACLRNYDLDFFTACVFEGLARSGVATKSYGYTHVEPVLRGIFPPTGTEATLFLCHSTCGEAVDKIKLLAVHPQYPLDPDSAGGRPARETADVAGPGQRVLRDGTGG